MVNLRGGRSGINADNGRIPPEPFQVILDRLNEQQVLMNQMRERQEEQAQSLNEIRGERVQREEVQNPPRQPELPRDTLEEAMSRFSKHQPPVFYRKCRYQASRTLVNGTRENLQGYGVFFRT